MRKSTKELNRSKRSGGPAVPAGRRGREATRSRALPIPMQVDARDSRDQECNSGFRSTCVKNISVRNSISDRHLDQQARTIPGSGVDLRVSPVVCKRNCNSIRMARLLVASRPGRCCARGRATRVFSAHRQLNGRTYSAHPAGACCAAVPEFW